MKCLSKLIILFTKKKNLNKNCKNKFKNSKKKLTGLHIAIEKKNQTNQNTLLFSLIFYFILS